MSFSIPENGLILASPALLMFAVHDCLNSFPSFLVAVSTVNLGFENE